MKNPFINVHRMNMAGQGGKIVLFALPFLVLALLASRFLPGVAVLDLPQQPMVIIGLILLIPGLIQWITGVAQLLIFFPRGRLITTGAYGVCRNPIYSSFIVFILPAIAFITRTWPYLLVSLALYAGVLIFIGAEEKKLLKVFGRAYARYTASTARIFPFGGLLFKKKGR
jgi:protein-S-isoprenylcysteine O-methyltransferase Ste14